MDANNVTADTLSHTSNAQRENSKAAFTSENLDKLNKLDATCKGAYMATSRDKYYKEMFKTLTDLMTATIRQYPTQRFKKQYVKSLKRNQ